jgi:membrane-associated HD superfamily phosphohydrolase
VVTALAQHLIVSNSSPNPQLTEQYRQDAENNVQPVQQSFDINSTIVLKGDIIDEADIEAMQQFGLMQAETSWQDSISMFIAVVLFISLLGLYITRFHPEFLTSGRHMMLLSALLVMFALIAKLTVPGRALLPFLYPAAGLSMLLTVLFDPNLAIAVTICLAGMVGFIGGNSLELAIYTAVGGIISSLVIKKSPRISAFFRTGVLVGIANTCVILIYRLTGSDLLGLFQLVGVSFLNGLFSAGLTLTGFFVVGNVFNVVTSLQLQERLQRRDLPATPGAGPPGPPSLAGTASAGSWDLSPQFDGGQPGRAGGPAHWRGFSPREGWFLLPRCGQDHSAVFFHREPRGIWSTMFLMA